MLDEFNHDKVHIKDRAKVEKMICSMVQGGKDKLQVIADFDRTLSRVTDNEGNVCHTCHNALDESQYLPECYKTQAIQTRDHYLAIENDPHLTIEEKYPYMVEWWTKAHNLLLQCHMTQDTIKQIVEEAKIILRDGAGWMFDELHKTDVPLLIFSAGVGDIIHEVLTQQYTVYNNMKIVSNFMDFNSEGKLVGFQGELIHIFNKNESAVHNSDYFENLSHRDNIVLIGDSLGDLQMAEGATTCKNLLKIGFLNGKVEKLLPKYMDAFDIVLVEDQTMEVANAIIKRIL